MIEQIIKAAGSMMKDGPGAIHGKEGLANFVTDKDLIIQRYLIGELSKLYPDAHFFGEEDTSGNDHRISEHTFFIDPIDGTTNYIFNYNHSCVSIGEAVEGKMVAGFIYNPFTDQLWKAKRGEGAWLNEQKLIVQNRSLNEGIVAFGCARYNEGDTDALFEIVRECYLRSLSVRNGGSAALDLAKIASSSNIAYIELKLQPYDYAAASVIIEEAGGVIGQVDGSDITLDQSCSILAGTPKAVEEIKEIIRKIIRE